MYNSILLSLVLLCSRGVISAAEIGPQLWSISAETSDGIISDLKQAGLLDLWSVRESEIMALVEPYDVSRVERSLDDANLAHHVVENDIFNIIEEETLHMKSKRRRRKRAVTAQPMDWTSYHQLQDIEGYLGWLNSTHRDKVRVRPIATSEEGRPVYVVRVSTGGNPAGKKKIWIEGGIHAREWISPAAVMFLLHQVATSHDFASILEKTIWYFAPVTNPDGYAHTFTNKRARLWRKNRSRANLLSRMSSMCSGVDLNRNWDLKWGVGASSNPCSETYKGPEPFSEPELRGLRRTMMSVAPVDLFITFHSYGQSLLYPWGWTTDPPKNVRDLHTIAQRFQEAVRHASGNRTVYKIGGSAAEYGLASGASDDWAFGTLGAPLSYTLELRDKGRYGFELPEAQILDTVQETSVGVYCMVSYMTNTGVCSGNMRPSFSNINNNVAEPRSSDGLRDQILFPGESIK